MKIIEKINAVEYNHHTFKFFEKLVLFFCLINIVILLFGFDELFSTKSSIIPIHYFYQFRSQFLLDILSTQNNNVLVILTLSIFIISLICSLFDYKKNIFLFLSLVLYTILHNRIHYVYDGGDRLIAQFLFFIFLMSLLKNVFFKKLVFLSLKIQIAFVYLVSSLYKLSGENWISGDALKYTLLVDEYTHPVLISFVTQFSGLLHMSTYSIILFQLTFPILIFTKIFKRVYILIGTCIHLFIAFGNGLFSFGIVMCISYCIFYEEKKACRIIHRISLFFGKIRNFYLNLEIVKKNSIKFLHNRF